MSQVSALSQSNGAILVLLSLHKKFIFVHTTFKNAAIWQ